MNYTYKYETINDGINGKYVVFYKHVNGWKISEVMETKNYTIFIIKITLLWSAHGDDLLEHHLPLVSLLNDYIISAMENS